MFCCAPAAHTRHLFLVRDKRLLLWRKMPLRGCWLLDKIGGLLNPPYYARKSNCLVLLIERSVFWDDWKELVTLQFCRVVFKNSVMSFIPFLKHMPHMCTISLVMYIVTHKLMVHFLCNMQPLPVWHSYTVCPLGLIRGIYQHSTGNFYFLTTSCFSISTWILSRVCGFKSWLKVYLFLILLFICQIVFK